jgi:hypothetical protein
LGVLLKMRETEMRETHALYSSVPQSTSDIINFRIKNSEDNSSWDVSKFRCFICIRKAPKSNLCSPSIRILMLP